MTTLYHLGAGASWQSLQARFCSWTFERLVTLNLGSGDLRFAVIALASAALTAAANAWVENIVRRALKGARFAGRLTAADTMVAAGGR